MTEAHPDTQGDEHRLFERMSRERFDALALWGMPQQMHEDTLSASHWSADHDETDPVCGRGWVKIGTAGRLVGHFFIHNGEDSGFVCEPE